MHKYWVYILLCHDDTFYTGMTSNIDQRIDRHQGGYFESSYTAARLPVTLVWYEEHKYVLNCQQRERQIKRWSQKKKKALIDRDYDRLRVESKKDFELKRQAELTEMRWGL